MSFSDLIFSYDNSLTSIISIKLVKKDIMDVTVLLTAPEIVKHVDTLTASALVRRGGWALIVLKVYTNVKRDWRLNVMKKQAICTNAPYKTYTWHLIVSQWYWYFWIYNYKKYADGMLYSDILLTIEPKTFINDLTVKVKLWSLRVE